MDNRVCLECAKEASRKWKLDHPEQVKARRIKNYGRYKQDCPEKIIASRKKDYTDNYDRFVTNTLLRKRIIKNQIPAWANIEVISDIYRKARATGLTVDHVIPLRGKTVCGLHVENNLQLLSQSENSSKGNKLFERGTIAAAFGDTGGRL